MPLQISPQIINWLAAHGLIHPELIANKEISYNDQLYFQNGYLIGKLLRLILKQHGHTSQGLLRIRKIAHISSNENWTIIKQIIKDLGFEKQIDPEHVPFSLINSLIQFLYEQFGRSPKQKQTRKEIKTHLDLQSLKMNKQVSESTNLLEFIVLCLHQSLSISLPECLGLLITQSKYLKQIIIFGVNNDFSPIKLFYEIILQDLPTLNNLISLQNKNVEYLMQGLGTGVLSQNSQICHLSCTLLNSLQQTEWVMKQGSILLLKSSHSQALDLLMQKINPQFQKVFNQTLNANFANKPLMFRNYNKIIKYLRQSIYCKQVFQVLPIHYYIKAVFQIFEPDNHQDQNVRTKLSAKQLLTTVIVNFWKQLNISSKNQIFVVFDSIFSTTEEENFTTIAYLCDIIEEMISIELKTVVKFLAIINKYYIQGNSSIKAFIIDNFIHVYKQNCDQFPIQFFLSTYNMVNIVQANDYHLFLLISENRNLLYQSLNLTLKICTIYYYQQLHAGCFINPINNLINVYCPIQWGNLLVTEILNKWPTLTIPPYSVLPKSSKKIKLRSIGVKKKQMLQFTQLHRYKSILTLLTKIKNKQFLISFSKLLVKTIQKVQKIKIKQMENTKIWLNHLLALLDTKQFQFKTKGNDPFINQQSIYSPQKRSQFENSNSYLSELENQQSQYNEPINSNQSFQNQFLKNTSNQADLLLPFSEQQQESSTYHFEDNSFQNFELIYIKNTNLQYVQLLQFVTNSYKKSANIQHFLKSINILNYVKDNIQTIQKINEQLKIHSTNQEQICSKLIQQVALLTFYFKRNRRITVKCLQSFYQLLLQKNNLNRPQFTLNNNNINKFHAKLNFNYSITPKIVNANSKIKSWAICFEILSDYLKRAIGIHQIEPISCIISEMIKLPISQSTVFNNKTSIDTQKNQEEQQLNELEKIIENQSQVKKSTTIKNYNSTPLKKSNLIQSPLKNEKNQNTTEKLIAVQKKVMNRRKQLEKQIQKNINNF